MSACVVDASVTIKWVVNEEGSIKAVGLLDGLVLYAPPLLITEAANALWKVARRGVIFRNEAQEALVLLGRAPFANLHLVPHAFDLAQRLNHSVYDCIYVAYAVVGLSKAWWPRSGPEVPAGRGLHAERRYGAGGPGARPPRVGRQYTLPSVPHARW